MTFFILPSIRLSYFCSLRNSNLASKNVFNHVIQIVALLSTRSATFVAGTSAGYCNSYSSSCGDSKGDGNFITKANSESTGSKPLKNNYDDLKQKLSPLQYSITQEGGTERPFTGKWDAHKEVGIYKCVVCGSPLFGSDAKYDSGSGWPSFHSTHADGGVKTLRDSSHGVVREEVRCEKCGSHLGHVFEDGPRPSGLRYCINSAAMDFEPKM